MAQAEGTFARAAAVTERLSGRPAAFFLAGLGLVAVVTVTLNLDTSAAFVTPVLVLGARRAGLDEEPFLMGSLFMANAASLLLPGSNLTNLLVVARDHVAGGSFAVAMAPAWIAAVVVTAAALYLRYRPGAAAPARRPPDEAPQSLRPGRVGAASALVAAVLVLALRSPALQVLGAGAGALALAVAQRRLRLDRALTDLDLPVLTSLYALAVALGALGQWWTAPARALNGSGPWATAAITALASVAVNNLPAAVLFTAHHASYPRELLIGLNLGPNLAVTGSLAAVVWYRAAQAVGGRPNLAAVSRLGLVVAPCSIAAAVSAARWLGPRTF